jgi:hypothetical protein
MGQVIAEQGAQFFDEELRVDPVLKEKGLPCSRQPFPRSKEMGQLGHPNPISGLFSRGCP